MNGLKAGDKVAILTSGGDAPGMNAAVRDAVAVALPLGLELLGVRNGYRGLVDDDLAPLKRADVTGWIRRGGSVLGTARCLDFHEPEVRARAANNLRQRGVSGLIVIGGNGSLAGAHAMASEVGADGQPLRVMGLPASIDNDIACTSLSIGVDTALNTITEACDRILDTASAHHRTFIVEVMGRACGYLAMTSAVAAGADGVLFPEANLNSEELIERVVEIIQGAYLPEVGRQRVLIVKSEGVITAATDLKQGVDARLSELVLPVETRVTVLGHVVRGGSPTAADRLIAGRLAHAAVRGLTLGLSDVMAGWHVLRMPGLPQGQLFEADPYISFWPLEQVLHETACIADGSSPVTQWRVRLLREAAPYLAC